MAQWLCRDSMAGFVTRGGELDLVTISIFFFNVIRSGFVFWGSQYTSPSVVRYFFYALSMNNSATRVHKYGCIHIEFDDG